MKNKSYLKTGLSKFQHSITAILGCLFFVLPALVAMGAQPMMAGGICLALVVAVAASMNEKACEKFREQGNLASTMFFPPAAEVTIDASSLAPIVNEITTAAAQEQTNSDARSTQLEALKGYTDGLEGKLDTVDTSLGSVQTAIASLETANDTASASVTSAINLAKTTIDAQISSQTTSLEAKHDLVKAAVESVETAIAAYETSGNAKSDVLAAALATVNTNLGTLETDVEAVTTAIGALNTDLDTFAAANATNVQAVTTAVGALQTAAGTNKDAVVSALSDVETAIDLVRTTATTESASRVAELQAIKALITSGNGDLTTLVSKATDIITGISDLDTNVVAKLDTLLKESDSTLVEVNIDSEIVDATSEEKIATIPSGSLSFQAYITNGYSGALEYSTDGGTTYKPLPVGVGLNTENLSLPGFDVGSYPEFKVKFPAGAYGLAMATKNTAIDVTVAGSAPAGVFTVTDDTSDPNFADYAGGYTLGGDTTTSTGSAIWSNGTRFAVGNNAASATNNAWDSHSLDYFATLADAKAFSNQTYISMGAGASSVTDYMTFATVGSQA